MSEGGVAGCPGGPCYDTRGEAAAATVVAAEMLGGQGGSHSASRSIGRAGRAFAADVWCEDPAAGRCPHQPARSPTAPHLSVLLLIIQR